ncbi:MAG: HisA/HisF-related TIM barrel protein [Planctomycetota bacterium]|nr:HisA/HisF-related TIM barrel protein [Planctomycetota bacterium]MDA1163402.1 HisA/HisF-related TIM barrel protein [Planctomycetota bacterium]
MRVIPVLDLLDSTVVRGVAGQRDKYRPVESCIARSASALDVATAFRETFGFATLYVADLDAILRGEPNVDIYQKLKDEGFELLVDSGLRNAFDAEATLMSGADQIIVGLETWPSLATLEMLLRKIGAERVIFSLDLKSGQSVRKLGDVCSDDPIEIGCAVIEAGIREVIVLDLASVGIASGPTTLDTCQSLRDFAPNVKLITGGGIRSAEDLKNLRNAGVDGALVASALHDGSITPQDL